MVNVVVALGAALFFMSLAIRVAYLCKLEYSRRKMAVIIWLGLIVFGVVHFLL